MKFDLELELRRGIAELVLVGDFDDTARLPFRVQLDRVVAAQPKRLVLRAEDLQSLSDECARVLAFLTRRLDVDVDTYLVGANDHVKSVLREVGVDFKVLNRYDAAEIQNV